MQTLLLLLRNIPNALSAARIGVTPVLGYLAAAGAQHYFTWVLVPTASLPAASA